MINGRNIWIFGGTGFIGQALVSHLITNPENKLHLLVHKKIPYKELEEINTVTGNIGSFDPQWLERYPPDVIFHLARISGSNAITRKMAANKARQANLRLVEILGRLPKPPVIVYVSGSLVYGSQKNGARADENSQIRPAAFARYIIHGEQPWLDAQKNGLLDVRFARPAWIIGPNSWFREFFWRVFQATGKFPCYGSGEQLMSLTSLSECARMIEALAFWGSRNQNLNIFSGKPVTQRYFAETAANVLGADVFHIPLKETKRRYGAMASEALTSSIPLTTLYPELQLKAGTEFQDLETVINNTLELLKNE